MNVSRTIKNFVFSFIGRMLVRTEDSQVRKQMLRQKLLLGDDSKALKVEVEGDPEAVSSKGKQSVEAEAMPTESPQCMHIVVDAVKKVTTCTQFFSFYSYAGPFSCILLLFIG